MPPGRLHAGAGGEPACPAADGAVATCLWARTCPRRCRPRLRACPQVDEIFYAAALAANKARLPLAQMAVKETRMGVVEDKARGRQGRGT